jgi:hypothetical protein
MRFFWPKGILCSGIRVEMRMSVASSNQALAICRHFRNDQVGLGASRSYPAIAPLFSIALFFDRAGELQGAAKAHSPRRGNCKTQ